MAISIDWVNKIISVPKADLQLIQLIPTEIRQLDINDFRLELKNLEDSEEGILFEDTHSHNPPVTVGGVTLARVIEIINDYTITFEDGQYAVNLVGANSNIADVTNVNQVSIRSSNSAGLTEVGGSSPSAIATAVWNKDLTNCVVDGTAGKYLKDIYEARITLTEKIYLSQIPNVATDTTLVRKILKNRLELAEGSTNNWILYDDNNTTPLLFWNATDKSGGPVVLRTGTPVKRVPVS